MAKTADTSQRRVSFIEIERDLTGGVVGADLHRADGLDALTTVQRAKVSGLRRERTRLEGKLGPNHARLGRVDFKIGTTLRVMKEAERERDRSRPPVPDKPPDVPQDAWVVEGRVLGAENRPLAGVSVQLEGPAIAKSLGAARTDATGSFRLVYTPDAFPKLFQGKRRPSFCLEVRDERCEKLHSSEKKLQPKQGQTDILDVKVKDR